MSPYWLPKMHRAVSLLASFVGAVQTDYYAGRKAAARGPESRLQVYGNRARSRCRLPLVVSLSPPCRTDREPSRADNAPTGLREEVPERSVGGGTGGCRQWVA
jgi:hypothetical protein